MGYHWFIRKCDGMCDTCDCPNESIVTPKQNEPTDLVVRLLEIDRDRDRKWHEENHLNPSTIYDKALTLAKLQSEALPLLKRIVGHQLYTQQAMYSLIIGLQGDANKLLRAIEEAKK